MRTRPILSLMCGALLGCGAPSSATNDETGGHGSSSSGGGGEGTLGKGETGGAPTSGAPTSGEMGSTGAPTSSTGTSGSLESTSTSTTDGSDGGCNFLCPSETGGCPGGSCLECDVWVQDCPQGQKCTAWDGGGGFSWNATKCEMVTGDGAPGEPCMTVGGGTSGVDDCAKGVMCWNVDLNDMGTCVGLCTGTPDAPMCPGGLQCAINGDGTLNLCLSACEPLLQDCVGTDVCIPEGDEFACAPDASGDEGQAHDACAAPNECDKGLVCLDTADASSACDPAAAGCCEPFCEFPDGACPAADQQCVQWFDPATLPMDDPKLEIGVCRIPK